MSHVAIKTILIEETVAILREVAIVAGCERVIRLRLNECDWEELGRPEGVEIGLARRTCFLTVSVDPDLPRGTAVADGAYAN